MPGPGRERTTGIHLIIITYGNDANHEHTYAAPPSPYPGSLSFLKNGLEHFPAAFRGIVRTSSPALEDFDSIRVDGKWEVGIEHSEGFFVELRIRTQAAVAALRFGIIGLDDS